MSGLLKVIAVSGGTCCPFILTANTVLPDNWLEPICMRGCL
ncbi:hypothetical protein [Pseudomonas cichorii]|nr:hypothetical protein [Pseudomonas cichorii]